MSGEGTGDGSAPSAGSSLHLRRRQWVGERAGFFDRSPGHAVAWCDERVVKQRAREDADADVTTVEQKKGRHCFFVCLFTVNKKEVRRFKC